MLSTHCKKYSTIWMYILPLFVCSQLARTNTVIGTSTQSTATERCNARLIVEDLTGTFHVVYYDNGVYHTYLNDGADTWSDPYLIESIARNPSIAIDSENQLHLVYKKGGVSAYDIVQRIYSGGAWSGETLVHHSAFEVSRPVLAVDTGDNLHCVWQRAGGGSTPNSEIYYSKCTSGSGWGSAYCVSQSYGASEYPTLTMDWNNNVYVFWKDSGEDISSPKKVLMRKYTVGSGWDTDYTIVAMTSAGDNWATMDPCAVCDSDNNIHLVWADSHSGNKEVYYKQLPSGSTTNISNTSYRSSRPTISIDTQDNLYVAWEDKIDNISHEILLRWYDNMSSVWSVSINISNTPGSDSRHPNCALEKKSSLISIWTEGSSPNYQIMFNETEYVSIETEYGHSLVTGNRLAQNCPNPFNSVTTIGYNLPVVSENINLRIFDTSGRLVRTIVDEPLDAGYHSAIWDGKDENSQDVPYGLYIYMFKSAGYIETRQCIVLR